MKRHGESHPMGEPIYALERQAPRIYLWGRVLTIAEAQEVSAALIKAIWAAKEL